jgi:hypothetical protein
MPISCHRIPRKNLSTLLDAHPAFFAVGNLRHNNDGFVFICIYDFRASVTEPLAVGLLRGHLRTPSSADQSEGKQELRKHCSRFHKILSACVLEDEDRKLALAIVLNTALMIMNNWVPEHTRPCDPEALKHSEQMASRRAVTPA